MDLDVKHGNYVKNKVLHWLKWFKEIYLEAYFNYINKKYISSVIILITIFEGICAYIIFQARNTKNVRGEINRYLNTKYVDKNKIIYGDREGLKEFIKILYANVDFEEIKENEYFNRNVLMHGRSFEEIGQKEVLKMFNAIDVLTNLIKY